jgi:hypothetical protein
VVRRLAGALVKIKVDPSGLKSSKWYEFLARFAFGGAVTAFAGLVAHRFGPAIGGLFLAFPAIVPATATLIRKREKEKKERVGLEGAERGREAAAIDVAGAAMGGFGLAVFSVICWLGLPSGPTALVLVAATVMWFIVAVSVWVIRERWCRRLRARMRKARSNTALQT